MNMKVVVGTFYGVDFYICKQIAHGVKTYHLYINGLQFQESFKSVTRAFTRLVDMYGPLAEDKIINM